MAGNYPDPPGFRIPWTMDGSVLVGLNRDSGRSGGATSSGYSTGGDLLGSVDAAPNDYVIGGNEQSGTPALSGAATLTYNAVSANAIVFPRPMTLTGIRLNVGNGDGVASLVNVWTSEDTTNGEDGTWTQRLSAATGDTRNVAARQYAAFAASNVRGIRFIGTWASNQGYTYSTNAPVILYGYYPETGDKLEAWSPTTNTRLDPKTLDFGDVPRSSSSDKSFRVKNLSGSLTAKDVQVSLASTRATTPPVAEQFVMSTDGMVWVPALTLGNLPPGSISDVIQLRRITPSNASLGPWSIRIDVVADDGWE